MARQTLAIAGAPGWLMTVLIDRDAAISTRLSDSANAATLLRHNGSTERLTWQRSRGFGQDAINLARVSLAANRQEGSGKAGP